MANIYFSGCPTYLTVVLNLDLGALMNSTCSDTLGVGPSCPDIRVYPEEYLYNSLKPVVRSSVRSSGKITVGPEGP